LFLFFVYSFFCLSQSFFIVWPDKKIMQRHTRYFKLIS
jgi:hypothetical protein